jgi:hypothetical protein
MRSASLRTAFRYLPSCVVAAGVFAAAVLDANAQDQMTCTDTAHAYACCQLSSLPAATFLRSCVSDRLKALGPSAKAAESKPKAPVNPVTCHDYAGKFSIDPKSLSAEQLVYLQACVDADIAYRRKGE